MKTFDVEVSIRATLSCRIDASSASDAEDIAHERATAAVERMGHFAHETDRFIHRINEVQPQEEREDCR